MASQGNPDKEIPYEALKYSRLLMDTLGAVVIFTAS
jgi:hypothetical protein